MHQLDVQKIDNHYYMVYDGDHKDVNKKFRLIRSLKSNFMDLSSYLKNN